MQINKCTVCNTQPSLVTPSAIEYDDVENGVPVKHHFHEIPMSYIECDCGQSTWHPIEAREGMANEWNAKHPLPETPPETPALPWAKDLPIGNKG